MNVGNSCDILSKHKNKVSVGSLSAELHCGHVNVPHSTVNRFFTTGKIKSTVSLTDQTVKCMFDRVSNRSPTSKLAPPDLGVTALGEANNSQYSVHSAKL